MVRSKRRLLLTLLLAGGVAQAAVIGTHDVFLEGAGGESVRIATLEVAQDGAAYAFSLERHHDEFTDQFLSMRPFRCLEGEPMVCHLGYPYAKGSVFTADDTADLEYEFLFIVRDPDEYGIDPYNGRYYRIGIEDGRLVGRIFAVDLNILAAPPEFGQMRPIGPEHLDELEPENERFPVLRFR